MDGAWARLPAAPEFFYCVKIAEVMNSGSVNFG